VSNCEAVAKDTIWQRWNGPNAPISGALVFSCLLSLVTAWFSYGALGPVICAVATSLALITIGFAKPRTRDLILPLLLAMGASALAVFGGGLVGPAVSAILWPVLAMAGFANRASSRSIDWIANGIGASCCALFSLALLNALIAIPAFDFVKTNSGILALGVCAALALGAIMAQRQAKLDQTEPALRQANQGRDAAMLEAQSARLQNRERAQFMAEMSHEIRTPLNAILGFADTMRAQVFGPLPQAYSDYPDLIHTSGTHLLDVVSDLLDLSKIEAGRYETNPKPLRLDEVAKEGVSLSSGDARAVGVNLRFEGESEIMVLSDRRALRQIIFNLVSNAIKFTPAGGQISVRVLADLDGTTAQLVVEDTGVGMSSDDVARIGQPWNQVSDAAASGNKRIRGSGLGLALVKRLAELQGGTLAVSSTLGVGTKASVTLPLAPAATITPPV
jgi:signal transduction histidine kinase